MTKLTSSFAFCSAVALALLSGCEEAASLAPTQTSSPSVESPSLFAAGQPQEFRFVEGYREGCDLAAREGKPVLLFFTAEWCAFCHQMEAEAFADAEAIALSQRFVCVRVDADRETDVCRQYQVRGYPTVQFLSTYGVPLNRLTGKKSPSQLVQEMQGALLAVAKRQKAGGSRLQ